MKKVSIIIPVYNAMTSGGGFIERCVNSAINQRNFKIDEIEILIINDGSEDTSLDTLQKIAKKYPHTIRLIDQKNVGVAMTRNKAITLALGEYVTFLDQDDWLDSDFLETYYTVAKENFSDIVIGGYRRSNRVGRVIKTFQPKDSSYGRYTISAAWAKLHRTAFLREHSIKFFDNSIGEDLPFTVHENIATERYKIISYIGYNWYDNQMSVSNTSQKTLTKDKVDLLSYLFEELTTKQPTYDIEAYNYYLLRTAAFYLLFSGRRTAPDVFIETQKKIFNNAHIQLTIVPPRGEMFRVAVVVAAFVLIVKCNMLRVFCAVWCRQESNSEAG